jgi:ADP-ribose pyrophosphatase
MDRSDQDDDRDRIEARDVIFDSPWVRLVSKAVVLMPGAPPERYFVLDLPDYVSICPRRRDGRFLLVRQYRPAVEQFLWEFPAGIVDPGETPEISVTRELIEETGHRPLRLVQPGASLLRRGRTGRRLDARARRNRDGGR